jgi:hypothetical protein
MNNIAIILSFAAGMNVVVSQVMKLLLMSSFKYVLLDIYKDLNSV